MPGSPESIYIIESNSPWKLQVDYTKWRTAKGDTIDIVDRQFAMASPSFGIVEYVLIVFFTTK